MDFCKKTQSTLFVRQKPGCASASTFAIVNFSSHGQQDVEPVVGRCRANMAHKRQLRLDSGLHDQILSFCFSPKSLNPSKMLPRRSQPAAEKLAAQITTIRSKWTFLYQSRQLSPILLFAWPTFLDTALRAEPWNRFHAAGLSKQVSYPIVSQIFAPNFSAFFSGHHFFFGHHVFVFGHCFFSPQGWGRVGIRLPRRRLGPRNPGRGVTSLGRRHLPCCPGSEAGPGYPDGPASR